MKPGFLNPARSAHPLSRPTPRVYVARGILLGFILGVIVCKYLIFNC